MLNEEPLRLELSGGLGRYTDGWTNQTPNPYRFGGAWGYTTDTPGSGLLQLGARYYWPELGRFIQQDPIGDGVNWYAYADNNPITGIDPEGLAVARPARPSAGAEPDEANKDGTVTPSEVIASCRIALSLRGLLSSCYSSCCLSPSWPLPFRCLTGLGSSFSAIPSRNS
ncbi:MAG: RHS repeat-associated core domain-containing protein [Armatimonadota bacterium]